VQAAQPAPAPAAEGARKPAKRAQAAEPANAAAPAARKKKA
jgi:hypothetical protein